jgi:amidase
MTDLADFSLVEISHAIRSGDVTPVKVVESLLERIEAIDQHLHGFVELAAEPALAQAHAATADIKAGNWRGLLHGVPLGLKDAIFTTRIKTGLGSPVFASWQAPYDATVVSRIEAAGGIILGKLTLTEGVYADHHPTTVLPVNPWGRDHWTGTSSSGAGVAVAAGLCYGALGTDTGGSIRLPSACCGVVGIKPTWGRVSRHGVFPLAESLDHIGPMCRTVADSAAMLGVIAGADSDDPTSSLVAVPDYMAALDRGVAGMRIGIDWNFIRSKSTDEVIAGMEAVVAVLEKLGAEIVAITFPETETILRGWAVECAVEAAIAHRDTYPGKAGDYGPRLSALIERGRNHSGIALAQVQKARREFEGNVSRIFADVDVLIVPGLPVAGPTLDYMSGLGEDPAAILAIGPFTAPFDVSRHPTITVPCGFSSMGVPMGFQFVGPHFSEATLCAAGHAYQKTTDWHLLRPSARPA